MVRTAVFLAAIVAGGEWTYDRLRPRTLTLDPAPALPVWERVGGGEVVHLPERFLIGEAGTHEDEFFAYLMFNYLRGAPEVAGCEVLLTYSATESGISYRLRLALPDNVLEAAPLLARAHARGVIPEVAWTHVTAARLEDIRAQTRVFHTAYNLNARRHLERIPRAQLISLIRRFVRFKSATDPRVRRGIAPVPIVLDGSKANRLAEDIVAVAEFYSLPLDFFIGIGAMENNYMNVEGDLRHAIWKRRPDQDDIVLKRARGRALVMNSSLGVWQITRETLRYAHRLYLRDERDYCALPERLRPPRELDVNEVDPEVLTTYAGLLFRDLLDRQGGDVDLATGAYNGGPGNPNALYADGVRRVAEYARRVMEHAAVLNGPAAEMRFFSSGP